MHLSIFDNIAAEEGWTPATQVDVLLGYIENQQTLDAFSDYLEDQRANDDGDDHLLETDDDLL